MNRNYNGSFTHLNIETGGFIIVTNVPVLEKSNVHCHSTFGIYYQQSKQAARSHLSFPVSSLNAGPALSEHQNIGEAGVQWYQKGSILFIPSLKNSIM